MEFRHSAWIRSDCRDHDGRNLGLPTAQLAQHVPTCTVGKVDVEQDQVGAIVRDGIDRGVSAFRFANSEPTTGEVASYHAP